MQAHYRHPRHEAFSDPLSSPERRLALSRLRPYPERQLFPPPPLGQSSPPSLDSCYLVTISRFAPRPSASLPSSSDPLNALKRQWEPA